MTVRPPIGVHARFDNADMAEDVCEAEIYPMFGPTENLVDIIPGHAANGSPTHLGLDAMNVIDAACESVRTRSSILLRSPGR